MLVLRTLTAKDAEAFQAAYHATTPTYPSFARGFARGMTFDAYLAHLEETERGRNLPSDHVPSTTYFGFIDNALVGRLMLRHRLNEALLRTGGNIGYVVVPEYRGRGFATDMLRLALPLARERGLDQALITCDEVNAASRRVIEKCGGILEGMSMRPDNGVLQCRYWIALC